MCVFVCVYVYNIFANIFNNYYKVLDKILNNKYVKAGKKKRNKETKGNVCVCITSLRILILKYF